MIDLFTALGGQGRSVVVSSHVLDEVERFGSRVLVIAQGRLAAEGDFRAIRDLMDDRPHRLRVQPPTPAGWPPASSTAAPWSVPTSSRPRAVVVDTVDAPRFRRDVLRAAAEPTPGCGRSSRSTTTSTASSATWSVADAAHLPSSSCARS